MDFPEVMRATTAWFGHLHDRGVLARRVEVVMVVGADMMKTGIHRSFPSCGHPLAIALRTGTAPAHFGLRALPSGEEQVARRCFYFETSACGEGVDVSSTEVRLRLRAKRRVDDLVAPAVAEALHAAHGIP